MAANAEDPATVNRHRAPELSSNLGRDDGRDNSRGNSKPQFSPRTIIAIGAELIAVKKILQHGAFLDWVQAECGFNVRSAENYIRAAEFAAGKSARDRMGSQRPGGRPNEF